MSWAEYIESTKNKPASPILVEALKHVSNKNTVLDLGAGALHDTRKLLDEGFKLVDIVDSSDEVSRLAETLPTDRIKMNICTFETFEFKNNTYDLINAQYSLPFCDPKTFLSVWSNLTQSLKTSGIFVGQFFGNEDEWSDETDMIFHTGEEVGRLLKDFLIIKKIEEKGIGKTALQGEKFWHVFHIIAKKK